MPWALALLPALMLPALTPPALAAPRDDFSRAVAYDLAGDQAHAFALYLAAAKAGMAEAQFNVAVMYDSGRGTRHDAQQAALFYAFAAVNGNARAAYNLGLLYDSGDGVARNGGLARAWYRKAAAAGLPAAAEKLHGAPATQTVGEAAAPAFPGEGAVLGAEWDFVPFVWLVRQGAESALYYVQIVRLEDGVARDVSTQVVDVSALRAPIGHAPGAYAWRVFSFAPARGTYVSSPWVRFSVSDRT